jgi:hypothetical protein
MSSKFVDILKNVGESISQSQGLKNALSDIGHDAKRMFELGASEAANALNHGHGFVLYGPNARPGAGDKEIQPPEQPAIESPEQGHGISM